jgi:hypothetical protein
LKFLRRQPLTGRSGIAYIAINNDGGGAAAARTGSQELVGTSGFGPVQICASGMLVFECR